MPHVSENYHVGVHIKPDMYENGVSVQKQKIILPLCGKKQEENCCGFTL